MKHTFKDEEGHLIASVSFDKDEIKTANEKAINKLVTLVTVPGFRKGKAPVDRASRYLRNGDVRDEMVNQLLRRVDKGFEKDEEFKKYVDGRKLLGQFRPKVDLKKFTEDEADFVITYVLRPEVKKLGEYKGLKSKAALKKVTDKDVEAKLASLAEDNAELVPVEREAKSGDTVNLDFVGVRDGKEFEGGSAKGFDLVLGSGRFVPGFEDQVVGHKAGEKFDIKLTRPENYPEPLTGKDVIFKVTVNAVKEKQVPEINDEFATTLSGNYASKDLTELKGKVKADLEKASRDAFTSQKVNDYLLAIRDASEFVIPQEYLDSLVEDRRKNDAASVEKQGLTRDEYLKLVKQTKEDYKKSLREGIEAELKSSLVFDALAEAEKIPAPDQKDLEKQIGSPLQTFVSNFTNYLKTQKLSQDQINDQINRYLNQVFSSIRTARIQAKVLELNEPKKAAAKPEEKPAQANKAEEPAKEAKPEAKEAK